MEGERKGGRRGTNKVPITTQGIPTLQTMSLSLTCSSETGVHVGGVVSINMGDRTGKVKEGAMQHASSSPRKQWTKEETLLRH